MFVELVCRGFDLKAPRKIVEVPARSGRNGVVRGNLWTTHTHTVTAGAESYLGQSAAGSFAFADKPTAATMPNGLRSRE